MNYKLVKFANGMYGVRRGMLSYEFKDFSEYGIKESYWWSKHSRYIRDCMSTEERAREYLANIKRKIAKPEIDITHKVIE